MTASSAGAAVIDLTSGTTGTVFFGQSFNETRAADITVLGPLDFLVQSMTLNHFNNGDASGTVGARIYNSGGSLIASADVVVGNGVDQSLTIPVSETLLAGQGYRVGFFLSTLSGSGGSGSMYDPDPSGSGTTPYTPTAGFFTVNQGFSTPTDVFPNNTNSFIPLTMTVSGIAVPEPSTFVLCGLGLLSLGFVVWRRRKRL